MPPLPQQPVPSQQPDPPGVMGGPQAFEQSMQKHASELTTPPPHTAPVQPPVGVDPVAGMLKPLQIPDNIKADAWDAWHGATDAQDFEKRFRGLQMPDDIKANLWDLKYKPPIDTAQGARQALVQSHGPEYQFDDPQNAQKAPFLERMIKGFTAPGTLFGPPTAQQTQGQQDLAQGVQESQAWYAQHPEAQQANQGFFPPKGGLQMPPAASAPHMQAYWQNPTAANLRGIPEETPFSPMAAGLVKPGTFVGGAAESLAGMASPANIAQLAAIPVNKLINMAYTGLMGKDTVQLIVQAKQQETAGNHQAANELYGQALVAGGMTLLTALGLRPEKTVRPQVRESAQPGAQPGVTPSPEPARVPQVGGAQTPNLAQEGGPRPITSPGISGGREIGGSEPRSAVSAPIEGGGGTTGTVTPKSRGYITPQQDAVDNRVSLLADIGNEARRNGDEKLAQAAHDEANRLLQERAAKNKVAISPRPTGREGLPDQRVTPGQPPAGMPERRTQALMDYQRAVQTTPPGQPTPGEQLSKDIRTARAGAPSGLTEGQVLQEIMRDPADYQLYKDADEKTRAKMLVQTKREMESQNVQRPTGVAQAQAPTSAQPAAQPIQPPRSTEKPTYTTGQSLRPVEGTVQEPVRAAGAVTPPAPTPRPTPKPYVPLPPEQRPFVPARPTAPAPESTAAPTPRPAPAPLGQEPRIQAGMNLEQKQEVARQRDEYLKQRAQTLPTKDALLEASRGPAAQAAATLDRTLTRHLKSTDENRPGRHKELQAAITAERAKGPEAAKSAAEAMTQRAQVADGKLKTVEHLLSRPTQEWDAEMRQLLHEPLTESAIDPKSGVSIQRLARMPGDWITQEGLRGGVRDTGRVRRNLDAATAEIYNDLRGNKMREVPSGSGQRVELDAPTQQKLADLQKDYQELLKTVRTQEGHRPTDEQLVRMKDLMQGIHALRQTRMLAESGPGSEPVGTGATNKFWNSLMGRSQGSHLGKPGPELLQARVAELKAESQKAREVAQQLGPTEAKTVETAPVAQPVAEAPKEAAKAPERAVEPPKPAVRAEAPKPAPEAPKAPEKEKQPFGAYSFTDQVDRAMKRQEAKVPEVKKPAPKASEKEQLTDLRDRVASKLEGLPKDDPQRAELQRMLGQIEGRLKPAEAKAEAPVKGPVAPASRPAESAAPSKPSYRTGEVRPAAREAEPEAPKTATGPSPQKLITEAFNSSGPKGLEDFTNDELRRAKPHVGAQTQTAIDAELKAREAHRPEIEKLAPRPASAVQAPKRAEHAIVSAPPAVGVGGKADITRGQLYDLGRRVDKLPPGEDRNDLASHINKVSQEFETLSEKIKWSVQAIERMRESGETSRTRTVDGKKITETLEQLENRVRNLGLERMRLVDEHLPGLKASIAAIEKSPVAPAPAPTPTRTEPVAMPTYSSPEVVRDPITGKYEGTIPAEKTGEKIVTPSPAPKEEGVQQRLEELKSQEQHLANMQQKFQTPNRGQAIAMAKLKKSIRAIRASLGKDAPRPTERVGSTLSGTEMLEKARREEPRPPTLPEVIPASEKGYVTGAPHGDSADELHSWLHGRFEDISPSTMKFIDNVLPKVGEAGDKIAAWVSDAVKKGEFGPIKEAAPKAAERLRYALDVLSQGRVKSLSAEEGMRSTVRAKAFSDAMAVARTGKVPVPKPKEGQEGFLGFGSSGRPRPSAAQAARISKNAIGRLAAAVEKLPASRGVDQRILAAQKTGRQSVPTAPNSFARAWQRSATLTHGLVDMFRRLPKWQDFESALGDFRVIKFRSDRETRNFVRSIQDKLGVPSLLRQTLHPRQASAEIKAAHLRLEALTNYLEAGGDQAKLQQRAQASGAEHRPGYELASNLNPEERALAEAIRTHFEERAKLGLATGIMRGYVENYAPHIWKDKGFLGSLYAEANAGLLNKNFRFAMQRTFGSFFEGEQRGLTPKVKRIDALVAIHNAAFDKALNTRLLAHRLFEGTAEDGRPILAINQGGATRLQGGQRLDPITQRVINSNPAYLLNPHSRPFAKDLDMSGYRQIPDNAFQKWMWKATIDGKNVMMAGDAWVHPDYFKPLRNLTGQSLIREYALGRAALKGTAVLKQSVLGGIGAFHYVQEGLHDVWHLRNPLRADIWTGKRLQEAMDDPEILDGIRHGLVLSDGNTMAEFGEALSIMDKIPGAGKYIRSSTDHLFGTFIPSLKADLYKHVQAKNAERYKSAITSGKLNKDQLKVISARTVNNAFGELDTLARNKTFQDIFRLTFLAPDFLEARARFLGQAVRPYGWQPFAAIMRNIGMVYTSARILNQVINKDPLWDGHYWDGVKIGDKIYRLRSIAGDFFHAVSNPANFFYWRLSPLTRPVVSGMASSRKGLPYRTKDLIADTAPIPAQGFIKKFIGSNVKDPGISRSLFETFGVHQEKYFTPFQRLQMQQQQDRREAQMRGEKSQKNLLSLPRLPSIKK